jgi:Flp pilus assembly protein TadG
MSELRRPLRLKSLLGDTRGIAAVEFALLAPVLILFYFGIVEFCQGFMALKRTGHAASMVADLVSRTDTITKTQAEQILDIGHVIMTPFPASNMKQRVSSVTRIDANNYRVDWSVGVGSGMTSKLTVADAKMPSDLLAAGESAIVSEAIYDYESPIGKLLPAPTRFARMAYLRPRTVDIIPCSNC